MSAEVFARQRSCSSVSSDPASTSATAPPLRPGPTVAAPRRPAWAPLDDRRPSVLAMTRSAHEGGTMPGRFENKVVTITGSGSGMGRETARLLTHEGAKVVVSDVNEARVKEAVALIEGEGGTV